MAEWFGLIGALAGTGIGGYVTYKVADQRYKHDRQSENEKRLVGAYESIHELLSQISSQASTLNLGVLGQLGFNSPLKGDILKEKVQLDRLRMLVDFYASGLQGDVKAISDQFTTIGRCVGETMLHKDLSSEWRSKTVECSSMASIEIAKLVEATQQKVAALFRSTVSVG